MAENTNQSLDSPMAWLTESQILVGLNFATITAAIVIHLQLLRFKSPTGFLLFIAMPSKNHVHCSIYSLDLFVSMLSYIEIIIKREI